MDGKFDIREDEEQGVKFNETVELLLAGGYFRARIKGLSPFDKIVGGMVWAITTSSYDVDIDLLFNENLSIGQKIALTEKIVKVLPKMKCPHRIEPHQIQGLDFIHIYPVVQWLVKKAIETRKLMGDFNKAFSVSQFDKHFTLPEDIENRTLMNTAKKSVLSLKQTYGAQRKYRRNDPHKLAEEASRVRSTLLEYGWLVAGGDLSAMKKDNEARSSKSEDDAAEKEEQQRVKALLSGMEQTAFASRVAASTVGSIVGLQADDIQEMARKYAEKAEKEAEQSEIEGLSKTETTAGLHQKLVTSLQKQIKQQRQKLEEIESEHRQVCESSKAAQKKLTEAEEEGSDLDAKLAELDAIAQSAGEGVIDQLRSLVAQNESLKQQEIDFKNQCKDEMNRLQEEIAQLKETSGLRNKAETEAIEAEFEAEQSKLNRVRILLAKRNREILVLRRKIDEVPSSAELSQYQKRFIELYNQVAAKHKETKLFYMLYNTLDDTKLYLEKEVSLLNSIYDSYQQVMQSNGNKDEFLKQMQLVLEGIKQTKQRVDKRKQENRMKKDEINDRCLELVEKERLYYKLIKEFTEECDKNEALQARLNELRQ